MRISTKYQFPHYEEIGGKSGKKMKKDLVGKNKTLEKKGGVCGMQL